MVAMGVIQTAFSVQGEPSGQTKQMGRKCYTKGTRQNGGKEDFGAQFAAPVTGLENRMVLPLLPEVFLSTSLISVHIPEFIKNMNLTFRHWFTFYTKRS